MNGPLTGTAANMSGRMAIVTKSPLTGTVTDSHHGGWSAARLRCAAAITPSGIAINAETSMPPSAKGTLTAARPAISSATGTPYV